MTARTHDIIAFASLVSVATIRPPESLNLLTLVSAIIAADVGALIPDMDQAGNRLWDLLPSGDFLGKYFRKIFYKHRTLSHSLLGGFLIYKFLSWILPKFLNPGFIDPNIILISVMVGYISHLVADAFTKDGLPLLFPFKFEVGIPPIKGFRIKTGGILEKYVLFPTIIVYLVWFIRMNQTKLVEIIGLVEK